MPAFRVGITPDFYTDAKGRFEAAVERKLGDIPGLECAPMPPQPGKIATAEALNEFDAIFALALQITAESLRGVERPALVARWGVGYDMIDVPALTEANIALAITPNAVKRPVAEAILTLIFALSKNLPEQDRTVRGGKWRGNLSRLGVTVGGKTLGSVGYGNIAREMFRLAASLGFGRFIAYDPYVSAETAQASAVELVALEQVFRESDYVTVNTLLNESTRGLIGEPQFRMMRNSAYFINTARGPIVDQRALERALREKWIAGAGIDVFEKEPVDPNDPLLQLDNVILAPHGLAWTEELARDNSLEACDHILSVARGEVPDGVVNREVLNRPGFQCKLEARRGQGLRSNS
jgi:phosphoglycerate dehydrogenase-like enzyme